jgi:RNA polymerase sigma-70 factor (ECF subfamily)
VQDTWLAVLQGVDRFEGRSSLRTWVYRILVNTAKKRGTQEQRSVPVSSLLPSDADDGPTVDPARFQGPDGRYPGHWKESPTQWPSPENVVLSGEVLRVIGEAMETLPARQRSVLTLRDVDGRTSAEVCDILEITQENQRVLLHRARAAVRARLETYFATVSAADREE